MSERFDFTGDELAPAYRAAVDAIEAGDLVVLPTDTVYGIAADAFKADAVQRLLDAKGRGRDMPPPVLISVVESLDALATDVPDSGRKLCEEFWPGPLTVICHAQTSLMWDLGDTQGTVALRVPDHENTRELLSRTGPLAVSSANRSGQAAAMDVYDAEEQLGESVAVYLDGGETTGGDPSTIVDITGETPRVVRLGALTLTQLRAVVPEITTDTEPATPAENTHSDDKPSDDQPSENAQSDDKPSDDQPSENAQSEDKPSDDQPSENAQSEDKPSDDQPSDDQPSEDRRSEDQSSEDQAADSQPAGGTTATDTTATDTTGADTAADDQTTDQQPAGDTGREDVAPDDTSPDEAPSGPAAVSDQRAGEPAGVEQSAVDESADTAAADEEPKGDAAREVAAGADGQSGDGAAGGAAPLSERTAGLATSEKQSADEESGGVASVGEESVGATAEDEKSLDDQKSVGDETSSGGMVGQSAEGELVEEGGVGRGAAGDGAGGGKGVDEGRTGGVVRASDQAEGNSDVRPGE